MWPFLVTLLTFGTMLFVITNVKSDHTPDLCDQILRFLKFLSDKFS